MEKVVNSFYERMVLFLFFGWKPEDRMKHASTFKELNYFVRRWIVFPKDNSVGLFFLFFAILFIILDIVFENFLTNLAVSLFLFIYFVHLILLKGKELCGYSFFAKFIFKYLFKSEITYREGGLYPKLFYSKMLGIKVVFDSDGHPIDFTSFYKNGNVKKRIQLVDSYSGSYLYENSYECDNDGIVLKGRLKFYHKGLNREDFRYSVFTHDKNVEFFLNKNYETVLLRKLSNGKFQHEINE